MSDDLATDIRRDSLNRLMIVFQPIIRKNRTFWKNLVLRGCKEIILSFHQQGSPFRVRRLYPEPQESQGGYRKDRLCKSDSGEHYHRGPGSRQDMAKNDHKRRNTGQAGGFHIGHLPGSQGDDPDYQGIFRPTDTAYCKHKVGRAGSHIFIITAKWPVCKAGAVKSAVIFSIGGRDFKLSLIGYFGRIINDTRSVQGYRKVRKKAP